MLDFLQNYLFCILDLIVLTLCCKKLSKEMMRNKFVIFFSILLFALLILITDYLLPDIDFINVFITSLILIFFIYIILEEDFYEKLFLAFILTIGLLAFDFVVIVILLKLLNITLSTVLNILLFKALGYTLSRGLFYLFIIKIYIDTNNVKLIRKKNFYFILVIFLFELMFIVIGYSLFLYYFSEVTLQYTIIYMSMYIFIIIILNIFLYKLINKMNEFIQEEEFWKQKEEVYKMQLRQIDQEYYLIEEFKRERHDYKQHLQMILGYINVDMIDKAKEYLLKINKNMDNIKQLVSKNHPEVASFLQYKFNIAEKQGIKIIQNIQLPEKIKMDIADLTVIIGNIMDNAIEANNKIPLDERRIKMDIYEKEGYLILICENPFEKFNKSNDNFKTTKEDKKLHGYGLENIKYAAKKNNGYTDITTNNGIFIIKVAVEN